MLDSVYGSQLLQSDAEPSDHPLGSVHEAGKRENEMNTKINNLFGASEDEVVSETGSGDNNCGSGKKKGGIQVEDFLNDYEIQY